MGLLLGFLFCWFCLKFFVDLLLWFVIVLYWIIFFSVIVIIVVKLKGFCINLMLFVYVGIVNGLFYFGSVIW